MEILPPELPVEAVQLVVVMRDGGTRWSGVRADHGITASRLLVLLAFIVRLRS